MKEHLIDLRGIACPMNFVKTKIELAVGATLFLHENILSSNSVSSLSFSEHTGQFIVSSDSSF